MSAPIEYVYTGRDNTVDLLLKADGVAVDLSTVTRMLVADVDGAFSVDSSTSPGAFDWNPGSTGKLVITLGDESIPVGKYKCQLIVYDPTNPDGVVWGKVILIVR